MPKAVVLDGVTKRFGSGESSVVALDGISLSVERGEFVSVVGPSGCGKTTLLEVVAGLQRPTSGAVRVEGDDVVGPDKRVGVVFQEESTFPWRNVYQNIEFGLEMRGVDRRTRRSRAEEALQLVGLDGFGDFYPYQLSGGMRQRVAVARTIVTEPEVVVMDEPFGALDEQTRLRLGLDLLKIVKSAGSTAILVTHSIQEAALLSARVVVLSGRPGRVRAIIDDDVGPERGEETLATDAFARTTKEIWSLLMDNASRALDHASNGTDAAHALGRE